MAVHAGIIRSLKNVVNVFMSPVVGALSDRWGRRPMMFYGRVGWLGEHDRLLASPLPAPMYMYRPLSPIPVPAAAHLHRLAAVSHPGAASQGSGWRCRG